MDRLTDRPRRLHGGALPVLGVFGVADVQLLPRLSHVARVRGVPRRQAVPEGLVNDSVPRRNQENKKNLEGIRNTLEVMFVCWRYLF